MRFTTSGGWRSYLAPHLDFLAHPPSQAVTKAWKRRHAALSNHGARSGSTSGTFHPVKSTVTSVASSEHPERFLSRSDANLRAPEGHCVERGESSIISEHRQRVHAHLFRCNVPFRRKQNLLWMMHKERLFRGYSFGRKFLPS